MIKGKTRNLHELVVTIPITLVLGCEVVVEPGNLPFEEKLVVSAVLEAGQPVKKVYFTRTMSLEQAYSPDVAAVADVQGFITCEGVSYPLAFVGQVYHNGLKTGMAQYSADGLVAQATKQYQLIASWNGHSLQARTRVPDSVKIDTTYLQWQSREPYGASYFIVAEFSAKEKAVYGGDYESPGSSYYYSGFSREFLIKPVNAGDRVSLNVFVGWRLEQSWKDTLYVKVLCFDEPFYDYYRTRQNSMANAGDPFFLGGENVFWNVEGDGLGLFIGMNVTKKRVYVP